jgi:preprotein translocase subunit SecG
MFEVLLAIHLVICVARVGAILLQRSEGGGALGIGGGGPGNMMSGRSASTLVVRTTQFLGAAFFATSLGLTWIAAQERNTAPGSVMEPAATGDGLDGNALDLGPATPAAPAGSAIPSSAPTTTAPEAVAPVAPVPEAPKAPSPGSSEPAK